jgi:hypothetical protein
MSRGLLLARPIRCVEGGHGVGVRRMDSLCLAGSGETLIASFYSREFRLGIVLRRTVQPGTTPSIVWRDWQGEVDAGSTDSFLCQAWGRRSKIVGIGNDAICYAVTQGAGTWKRPLVPSEPAVNPDAPTNLIATADIVNGTIALTWADASTNEPAIRIQLQASGSSTWTTLSHGVVSYLDSGLASSSTFHHRVGARGQNEGF